LEKGQNSLKFVGLTFQNTKSRWFEIGFIRDRNPYRNDYIWFDKCTFYNAPAYSGIIIDTGDYGKITNCVFPDAPILRNPPSDVWGADCQSAYDAHRLLPDYCDWHTAPADLIQGRLGAERANYWVIEGNTFGNASHDSFNGHGGFKRLVFRNNTSNSRLHTNAGFGAQGTDIEKRLRILIEGNTVFGGGIENYREPTRKSRKDRDGLGLYSYGPYNIIRYNQSLHNNWGAMIMTTTGSQGRVSNKQYSYHNSFVNNYTAHCQFANNAYEMNNNIWKNNIFYHDGKITTVNFSGTAPDIGAFQYGSTNTTPPADDPTPPADDPTPPPSGGICHKLDSTKAVPTGFGAAYNTLTLAKEQLMSVNCQSTSATVTVGSNADNQFIYSRAYIWRNNAWQQLNLTGNASIYGSNWLKGSAQVTGNLTAEELSRENNIIAFVCSLDQQRLEMRLPRLGL
jgi:hypothetical protein